MSDQTPSLGNLGSVDGRNLINVPGGGGGNINSINGDVTPAQVLAVGAGLSIVDGGGGLHTISLTAPGGVTSVDGTNANPQTGAITVNCRIGGIVDGAAFNVTAFFGGFITIDLNKFSSGHQGIVSDPGAAAATDYLGADNTFRPLPLSAVQVAQTVSGGDNIPDNTPTAICPVVVPATGFYQVSANVKFTTVAAGEYLIELQDDFAVSVIASQTVNIVGVTFPAQLNCSMQAQATVGGGHTFSIIVTQKTGGPLVTSADLLTSLNLLFLSA